jgi:hypothetical protein
MFEHPDRDDPVEPAVELAIIDQLEPDPIRHPRIGRAPPRHAELLLAQRHAEHVDIGGAVQIQRHAAPSAADVEHPLPRCERQLGRDMRLLVGLRALQRHRRIGEIGAAILAIGVEEEIVQSIRQIVMMRHVAPRRAQRVEPPDRAQQPLADLALAVDPAAALPRHVRSDQVEQADDVAAIDHHPAIHERLAHAEPRVPRDVIGRAGIQEADRHRFARRVGAAIAPLASVRGDHGEVAAAHDLAEHLVEQEHGDPISQPSTSEGILPP